MDYTFISQGRCATISRLSDTHALLHIDNKLIDIYCPWYAIGKKQKERQLTNKIHMIVGQLIEDGWECVFVG